MLPTWFAALLSAVHHGAHLGFLLLTAHGAAAFGPSSTDLITSVPFSSRFDLHRRERRLFHLPGELQRLARLAACSPAVDTMRSLHEQIACSWLVCCSWEFLVPKHSHPDSLNLPLDILLLCCSTQTECALSAPH